MPASRNTPINQRTSQKRALPPGFIGTLFFPSDRSDETNVPKESYRRSQQIPATRHSGKEKCFSVIDPSILFDHTLYRFIPTDCIVCNSTWHPKRLQCSHDFTGICCTGEDFRHKKRRRCTHSSVPHKPKRAL